MVINIWGTSSLIVPVALFLSILAALCIAIRLCSFREFGCVYLLLRFKKIKLDFKSRKLAQFIHALIV